MYKCTVDHQQERINTCLVPLIRKKMKSFDIVTSNQVKGLSRMQGISKA